MLRCRHFFWWLRLLMTKVPEPTPPPTYLGRLRLHTTDCNYLVLYPVFHYFFMIRYFQAQLVNGTFIPVVFSLLPNKLSDTYLCFFREVAKLADNMFQGKVKVLHPCEICAADPDTHGTPVTKYRYLLQQGREGTGRKAVLRNRSRWCPNNF